MVQTRRAFLGGMLAAGVGGGLIANRRVQAGQTPSRRKMTIDLVCGNIGVIVKQREAIDLAHRHGFESVAPDGPDLVGMTESQRTEVVAELKSKNLVWGAAGVPFRYRVDDAAFAEGMKKWPAIADALRFVGATRVGTWVTPSDDTLTYLQNFKRTTARLRELAKVLKDRGLRFGLEYVGPKNNWTNLRHGFIHTLAEMKELIAEIDMANVGVVLDSWHWYCAGETEADILSLKGEEVVAVDLNDAPAGVAREAQVDNRRELPATTGVIDIATFLNALVKIGYDGPVRPEPFNATLNKMDKELSVAAAAAAMKRAFAAIK